MPNVSVSVLDNCEPKEITAADLETEIKRYGFMFTDDQVCGVLLVILRRLEALEVAAGRSTAILAHLTNHQVGMPVVEPDPATP